MAIADKMNLSSRWVVITGGAGLLGRQHADAILQAQGRVILWDINESALNATVCELEAIYPERVLGMKVDITREADVVAAADEIRKKINQDPDVLINNAAIDPKFDRSKTSGHPSRLEGFSMEQWNLELSVGLTGSLICAKVLGARMAQRGRGVILNIASDLGVIAPDQRLYAKPGLAEHEQNVKPVTYSVIKHGLIGLTKYLATYWANHGVRANAFAPGGMFNQHPEEFTQKISQLIPMGRMAEAGEYQSAIVFLCSDASSYMNGSVLVMDGGRSVW